jgi:GNAT superfamily N-acetyltransferase
MIRCEKARPKDAVTLARISERAFHSDIYCGAPGLGGPPGYKSEQWQREMMRIGDYYKVLVGDQIVGGFIVLRKEPREYELGRIFVDPDYQNQGVGTEVMEFLWEEYPLAKRWTLDTPAWNRRTRHFYNKVGFAEVGADPRGQVLFEKRLPARGVAQP